MMGTHADVAQLVEHHLAKVRVASSNLVIRSKGRPSGRPFSLLRYGDDSDGGVGLMRESSTTLFFRRR